MRRRGGLRPYVQIARIDHWFKNAFMLLGVILAVFYQPEVCAWSSLLAARARGARDVPRRVEQLRAQRAARRAEATGCIRRRSIGPCRPARSSPSIAYAEWLALGGRRASRWRWRSTRTSSLSALWLWVMGILYNVPPLRTKEWPYLDVLSESVNNPIRLLLGWFALVTTHVPPLSLVISYWMVGAFFMAMKRYAEYRHIGDRSVAAALPAIVRVLHRGAPARQHRLLRDRLRAVRRHLHRPLPPRADPVRAVRRRPVRVLHAHRHAAGQPGAEPREALPAARLLRLHGRLRRCCSCC